MKYLLSLLIIIVLGSTELMSQVRPDQKLISYNCYNRPLRQVLQDLSRISKVNLVYSETRIPVNKPVTINAKNQELGLILKLILEKYSCTYKIVGNQIVVVKDETRSTLPKDAILYGYIKDKQSGERLIGANIYLQDKSQSTVTNEQGFFTMKVARLNHRIYFDYVGYEPEVLEFFVNKDSVVNVELDPDILLNEIVIIEKVTEGSDESASSQHSLHRDRILTGNQLLGEPDVFRTLSSLPGVTTGADGTGGLNVRGGSADQNLVLLDGVPLYNTGHALGIYSVFNSNAIKSVNFYNGGIPARYAGRLSSVIDVHTKDGNYQKLSGDFNVSIIAVTGTLEGPIRKDKSSFIVSARRTWVDPLVKNWSIAENQRRSRSGEYNYYFSDLNAKLNFQIGKKSRLLISTLLSNDQFSNESKLESDGTRDDSKVQLLGWGNALGSIRFVSEVSKKMYTKTTLYGTQYQFESFRKNRFEIYRAKDTTFIFDASLFDSKVKEVGLKHEWDYNPNSQNAIKFGVYGQLRVFNPKVTLADQSTFTGDTTIDISLDQIKGINSPDDIRGNEYNAYIEDEINISPGVKLHVGLNYSIFQPIRKGEPLKTYSSIQPRLALLAVKDRIHFKLGVSSQQQNLHLITNDGLGLPTDIWIPVSRILPPQKSWVINSAFGYKTESGYRFGADVYYKLFSNISTSREGRGLDINATNDWEAEVPIGAGTAYGFEIYVDKQIGNNILSTNYTYSISNRIFPDINTNQEYEFGYNRRHSFKFNYIFRLSKFSEFSISWMYLTGTRYSKPENLTINPEGPPVVIFPLKNNAKFEDFHRLDVGFSFFNERKWGRSKLFLGLFNAYNRQNPFYTELVSDAKDNGAFKFYQYSLPPFLPTFSYGVAF